jgi:uncharacterized LabA/DUF88 family protein
MSRRRAEPHTRALNARRKQEFRRRSEQVWIKVMVVDNRPWDHVSRELKDIATTFISLNPHLEYLALPRDLPVSH